MAIYLLLLHTNHCRLQLLCADIHAFTVIAQYMLSMRVCVCVLVLCICHVLVCKYLSVYRYLCNRRKSFQSICCCSCTPASTCFCTNFHSYCCRFRLLPRSPLPRIQLRCLVYFCFLSSIVCDILRLEFCNLKKRKQISLCLGVCGWLQLAASWLRCRAYIVYLDCYLVLLDCPYVITEVDYLKEGC